jgi:hypothetical protein
MIFHTTNILVAPLLLVAWTLDVYVFLACLRLLLARVTGETAAAVCRGLRVIVDPLPAAIGRWLVFGNSRPRAWLPWLIVILAAVSLRYALVGLVLLVQ